MRYKESRKLNSTKDSGAALIVAVVVMMILIVFTFMLTLLAYTLYVSQNKNISSMRCAEATNTLSLAFDEEMQDVNAAQRSHLYQYARFNVGQNNWPYYDAKTSGHDKTYAFRYYSLKYNPKKLKQDSSEGADDGADRMDGFPGNVKICMYWELPEGVTYEQLSTRGMNGILLFVEITSEAANQSYTVTNVYELKESGYTSDLEDLTNQLYIDGISTDEGALGMSVNPLGNGVDTSRKWEWVRVYDKY